MIKALATFAVCSLWVPGWVFAQTSRTTGTTESSSSSQTMGAQQDNTSTTGQRKRTRDKDSSSAQSSTTTNGATPQSNSSATSNDITPGTSGSTSGAISGTQSGTSDMRARMNRMFDDCQAAQTALDQGEALLRQSMTGASANSGTSAGTLNQADQKFSEARAHLTLCNAMLSQMRAMHHGMGAARGTNNPH